MLFRSTRIILPALGNEFITLIKETAVLSVITVVCEFFVLGHARAARGEGLPGALGHGDGREEGDQEQPAHAGPRRDEGQAQQECVSITKNTFYGPIKIILTLSFPHLTQGRLLYLMIACIAL